VSARFAFVARLSRAIDVLFRSAVVLALLAPALRAQREPPPDLPAILRKPTPELIDREQAQAEPYVPGEPLPPPDAERAAWLARDPNLRGLDFRSDAHLAPIEVLVQSPGGDEPHVQRVGWTYATWLSALDELFRARYVAPSRRVARPEQAALIVVVVTQPATFAALRSAAGARDVWDEAAFYAPQLPAVVVFDPVPPAAAAKPAPPPVPPPPPDPDAAPPVEPTIPVRPEPLLRPVLHAAVHALLDAWCEPGKPPPLWLAEGLAQQLSAHEQAFSPDRPSLSIFDSESLRAVALAGLDRPQRIAFHRPLAELTSIATVQDLDRLAEGLPVPAAQPLQGLACEAELLLAWLDDPDEQPVAHGVMAVGEWMAGRGGGAVSLPSEPRAMEAEFVSWTQEQMTRRVRSGAESFTLRPEPATPEEVRPGVLARLSDLAVPSGSVEVERARALWLATRGDLASAMQRCQELAARGDASPTEAAALKLDLRLLPALQDLRQRWAAAHAGKLLDFHEGELLLRTTLVRVEGDKLVVRDKGRERSLPMTALVPSVLAAQLVAPGSEVKGVDDEARAYAWLIAGDAEWKDKTVARLRKDSGPAALALIEQRAAFEATLATGRGLAELGAVADGKLPLAQATEAERDAWLARLRPALADRALPVVAGRLPVLRALGRRVLGARFEVAPLKHLALRGKLEELGDDRLRITWGFADAAELSDWEARPFEADLFTRFPELIEPPQPEGLQVQDGAAIARGSGLLRCKLPLAAPLSLDYDLRYALTSREQAAMEAGLPQPPGEVIDGFALRTCADDYGSGLTCAWFGSLMALDKRAANSIQENSSVEKLLMDKRYHLRLEHDGARLHSLLDGQEVATCSALKLTGGALEIWHHTQRPIFLDNLVVEGTLDRAGLRSVREAWVEGELVALGGGE
jgi:hypothetical protein